MNIIITGCLGHIGSYLIENLAKFKKLRKIYLLDNIANNKFTVLNKLKKDNKRKIFFYEDLSNPKHLFKIKKITTQFFFSIPVIKTTSIFCARSHQNFINVESRFLW